MYRNSRALTITGGQHLQVNGDYYHVHPRLISNEDAAVRKREGERPISIPRHWRQIIYFSSRSTQEIV